MMQRIRLLVGPRRWGHHVLVTLLAAGSVVLLPGNPARAQPADAQGWWTVSNAGNPEGLAVPGPPPPPDVPSDGLLVEGGPTTTTAFAALIYTLPAGATVQTLTLTVAPGSVTSPSALLELCPVIGVGIRFQQGGPMTDAPSFDCTQHVTATPDPTTSTYVFQPGQLVRQGRLAVAILPTVTTDRVVLNHPGAGSLAVSHAPTAAHSTLTTDAATSAQPPSATRPFGPVMSGTRPPLAYVPAQQLDTAPTPPDVAPTTADVATSAPITGADATPALASTAAVQDKTSALAATLFIGGLVVAGVIWTVVGRAARRPDHAAVLTDVVGQGRP